MQKNTCPICLTKNTNQTLICGHQFCKKCIKKWLKIKEECPICRADVNTHKSYILTVYEKDVFRVTYILNNLKFTCQITTRLYHGSWVFLIKHETSKQILQNTLTLNQIPYFLSQGSWIKISIECDQLIENMDKIAQMQDIFPPFFTQMIIKHHETNTFISLKAAPEALQLLFKTIDYFQLSWTQSFEQKINELQSGSILLGDPYQHILNVLLNYEP